MKRQITILLATLVLAIPAVGQLESTPTIEPGSESAAPAATNPVDVKVVNFGVGGGTTGAARPGDWTGIQVEVLNQTDKVREVVVQVGEVDADGDTAERQRDIVANPNVRERVWVYTRMSYKQLSSLVYTVGVYEAVDAGSSAASNGFRFRPGKLLGQTQFRPRDFVSAYSGMVGVVGQALAGLDQYQVTLSGWDFIPGGHELTRTIGGISPADLPDRWQGLMSLDALVWTASGMTGRPQDLTQAQSEAIREWVARGGHLIVVLPTAGQEWLGRRDHLLTDIMPVVSVRTEEGVAFRDFRPLLVQESTNRSALPPKQTVNFFEPDRSAGYGEAIRVLDSPPPDGRCVVCRRLVGAGAVTVIGINIAGDELRRRGVVEADAIWNRVLGKRSDLFNQAELAAQQTGGSRRNRLVYSRPTRDFEGGTETGIPDQIKKKSRAAAGLLLAFVVFLAYWLVAGPVGFLMLRNRGWKHHAWVAFLAAAGVFTGLAWGGASWLKPRNVDLLHVTLLDHVYGQPVERARSFISILLPGYGDQRVSIAPTATAGGGDAVAKTWHNVLAPWDAPSSGIMSSDSAAFPDTRGYQSPGRDPDFLVVPSRATVKQFQADWAGPPRWRMPTPSAAGAGGETIGIGREIVLKEGADGKAGWQITGTLTHGLPRALEDVVVIVVRRQTDLVANPSATDVLVRHASAITMTRPWAPGEELNLATELAAVTGRMSDVGKTELDKYLESLLGRPSNAMMGMTLESNDSGTAAAKLTALSLYSMMPPPLVKGVDNVGHFVARRQLTHGYDLGRWFTQPCVIVIGQLPDSECPVPMRVNGRDILGKGRTVVRWVYPLPDNPPGWNMAKEPTPPEPEIKERSEGGQ